MARTLPPVQAIHAEIDALFTEGRDLVEVIEDVARLGARLIIQTAVEAEVDAFLGRARYQRTAAVSAAGEQQAVRPGHRNGHCPTTVKTTSGPITIARPKLRGTTETFASRLFGTGVSRTNALETLVIASFVRGLSVRDVEGALADALGPEAALSKSTVSAICQAIVTEYDTWCRRDLSALELDYLFCDASHFKMHDGQRAEPVLAAWGITTDGKPVFAGLAPAAAESTDAWHDFLTDLAGRGLRPPLLVVSDAHRGLVEAVGATLAGAAWQRCRTHCEVVKIQPGVSSPGVLVTNARTSAAVAK
ncbi:transposase [Planomonospora sp. ID67723]|uniref:IS256 family transposase n=1 Tax=Planomonospora sp. ID67723 TaxID=2738134 RepID=UPI0018C3B9BE|nr:transposase [Planomonospora sp. ID67723]MBG0831631.1 transposase [Planomonospora sp. ID67723]